MQRCVSLYPCWLLPLPGAIPIITASVFDNSLTTDSYFHSEGAANGSSFLELTDDSATRQKRKHPLHRLMRFACNGNRNPMARRLKLR